MNISGSITDDTLICGNINENTALNSHLIQNDTVIECNINQKAFLNVEINKDTFLNGGIKEAVDFSKKELYFSNRFEFPSIGQEDRLYVASDEGAVYLFSAETLCYICMGRDYNKIDTIVCGL